jgi:hypothetical protein
MMMRAFERHELCGSYWVSCDWRVTGVDLAGADAQAVCGRASLLWLGTQPKGPAKDPAPSPLRTLGAPHHPGQREELTCQVSLLGPREHLTAPIIGKLAGLIWMHDSPLLPDGKWH